MMNHLEIKGFNRPIHSGSMEKAVDGPKGEQEEMEGDALLDWEPEEILWDDGDVRL